MFEGKESPGDLRQLLFEAILPGCELGGVEVALDRIHGNYCKGLRNGVARESGRW